MSGSVETVASHLRALATKQAGGARLPSVRDLMRQFGVSPVTVRKALVHLGHQGIVESKPGQGIFVVDRKTTAERSGDMGWQALALGPRRASAEAVGTLLRVPQERIINLGNGYLPEHMQATHLLASAANRALRRPGIWNRVPLEGIEPLCAWFADEMAGAFNAHEITICPGTQSALAAAFRALTSPGDSILMESPTYTGAIAAARAGGLNLVPVPTDRQGIRVDLLEDAFRTTGARILYMQPTYANPTGAVLASDRRDKILALLARYNAFLIEDDWARDFCLDGSAPPPPLAASEQDGHIIYIRSLTKSAAPGLRVGAVCARGPALERLRAVRAVEDFFVSGLLQETTLQLVTSAAWPRHLRNLRVALRERRDALVAAVHKHLGHESLLQTPSGGLHAWIQLPVGVSDMEVTERAAQVQMTVSPGWHWFPADAPGSFLRLSFAALPPASYDEAIARLADICTTGRERLR
ncbi:MAG TPA: PLP-dependent aminotransferase family protein [Pseudolabrys sp.]